MHEWVSWQKQTQFPCGFNPRLRLAFGYYLRLRLCVFLCVSTPNCPRDNLQSNKARITNLAPNKKELRLRLRYMSEQITWYMKRLL